LYHNTLVRDGGSVSGQTAMTVGTIIGRRR
jgi:hypothetical protein